MLESVFDCLKKDVAHVFQAELQTGSVAAAGNAGNGHETLVET
jgi:hypothetical protein